MATNEDYTKRDKIELVDALKILKGHWKLFVIGVAMALVFSFAYLKFATYKYEVSSTILINDEDNDGGSTSEISVFQDLGLFVGPKTSLETEIGILKSKSLIERVVKDLDLNITYFIKNGLIPEEVYKGSLPFKIHFFLDNQYLNAINTSFTLQPKQGSEYTLLDEDGEQMTTGNFGEKVSLEFGDIIVTPKDIDVFENEEITIKIKPLEEMAIAFNKRIEVIAENPKSNLLTLRLQDPIKLKAREILDSLVSYYNEDAINYKNLIAKNTTEFLNSRIDDVLVELNNLDQGVETYKSENKLSNIDYESNINLATNASVNKQIVELNSQLKLIDYLMSYMETNKDDLIPSNLGGINDNMAENTAKYNNLLLDRERLSKGANSENPIIVNLNNQISSLRKSIDRSLINQRSSLTIDLRELRGQEQELNSQIVSTPKKERDIQNIERQQDIIESLYLYLLQKREENSISSAVTLPYAIVIDKAYGSSIPVSPRKIIVILTSVLLGLLIPAAILTLRALFDNKIHTYDAFETIIKAPLIGDIPKTKFKKDIVTIEDKNTRAVAEAFRLLRTNIIHALKDVDKNSNAIFITSTTSEEGKTFLAANLATSFGLLNKKILVIEANIRNPKIANFLNLKTEKGLFHFLKDTTIKPNDIISHYQAHNFDVISAGISEGQYSELLNSARFNAILDYGRQHYDYVLIDTPAIHVDSDTLMLAKHADLFLYVVRSNTLTQSMLKIPKTLHEKGRLPNMHVVMNDTNTDNQSIKVL